MVPGKSNSRSGSTTSTVHEPVNRLGSTPTGVRSPVVKNRTFKLGFRQCPIRGIRQAIDEGWRTLWWYYLKQDPSLESLHDEPEFQAMVEEIEADMAVQLARVREMERNGELEPIPEVSATTQ